MNHESSVVLPFLSPFVDFNIIFSLEFPSAVHGGLGRPGSLEFRLRTEIRKIIVRILVG